MSPEIPIYQLGIFADKYPLTVGEYRAYQPLYINPWEAVDPDPKLPATGINWQEARVYCEFLGKRLPTTLEWIYCATGMMLYPSRRGEGFEGRGTKREFPWGNEAEPNRCNCAELGLNRPTPVDQFGVRGESPLGVGDTMGNVWEMTATYFGESFSGRSIREDDARTIMGGHFKDELLHGGIVGEGVLKMDMLLEGAANEIIGFRCVRDFNERDLAMNAPEINKAYHGWCVECGSPAPGKDHLLCDFCGKQVSPEIDKSLGSEKHNISVYCDPCFLEQGASLLRPEHPDRHKVVFYGIAVGFLIAYMGGHARGGDYVYRDGGLEEYAKRCRLRSVRTSLNADIHRLLSDIGQT
jgi:hypothetical protein